MKGTELKEPRGLRIGADGCFYVSDAGLQRIVKITAEGKWWPLAGSLVTGLSGDGSEALNAALNTPLDLLLQPDGRIRIADAGNNRIRELIPQNEPKPVEPGPAPAQIVLPEVVLLHAATLRPTRLHRAACASEAGPDQLQNEPKVTLNHLPVRVLSRDEKQLTIQIPASISPDR
ncbi:MAG: hypothetical protein WKF37_15555 [Bryobacteraceae bacterium]